MALERQPPDGFVIHGDLAYDSSVRSCGSA
jgi:hypothetical protein